ncbi:MAG: hypothetical protein F6K62_21800, partial [Sphaerospermopsis sp. SIO1G2]|nr:hypothetical protein [Sphaerospermopsis sp. SIO1G2]
MNMSSSFPQIIYGKLVGNNDSGYRIIAWNHQENPHPILPPYRFWGESSPNVDNIKTVGLVWDNNQPILIQATAAINTSTNQSFRFTNTQRGFTQYRYVFLTSEFLTQIQGRIDQLLQWLYDQTIDTYYEVNQNLQNLAIPLPLETNNDLERVQYFLNNYNHSLISYTQDCLFSNKRVLVTPDQSSFQTNGFFQTLLLLLPLAIRCKISLAIGTIDEKSCNWANLIIKLNQPTGGFFNQIRVSDDVVWLNQVVNEKQKKLPFNSNYVNCLQLITQSSDQLPNLLNQLNQMNSDTITLTNPIHPQGIIPLIQFLPSEQQREYLSNYLSQLNSEQELQTTIDLIDNEKGINDAWDYLIRNLIQVNSTQHNQNQYPKLAVKLWTKMNVNQQIHLLDNELNNNLPLAEKLIYHNLLDHFTTEEIAS